MKLIIQIPCYNEEKALPITLPTLPRELEGIDEVEWLIIDDGSIDSTVKVAKAFGVNHIISFPKNKGLAKAFIEGLRFCVEQDADIIINFDADNQYSADDIPKLLQPFLENRADIVIGDRPIQTIERFSFFKKKTSEDG